MKENNTTEEKSLIDFLIGLLIIAGIAVAFPALIFVLAVVRAFVISQLWTWYIVPFFGAAALPLAVAFGISLLIGYLTPTVHAKDERPLKDKLFYIVGYPLFVLLFGWIGTFFL